MEEIRCLLWMVMVFGAGNPKIWTVLQHWETPQNACAALREPSGKYQQGLPSHTMRRIRQVKTVHVDEMLARCQKEDISIVWYGDERYPEDLLAIVNPPVLLFYRGNLAVLQDTLSLTVVGTRHPSDYSMYVARTLCRDLVQLGFVLVTGFAVGIDITANRCALEAGKPSVALMGCGLDVAYPQMHAELKKEIAVNGLILSEFLPGTTPAPSNFPLRNRVLSGLTMGTLVIQAPLRSGALITAENAMEQGRDVFCIPPANIFDKQYQGVIKYLRDGAIPVFDSRDIVYEYYTSHAYQIDGAALYDENRMKSDSLVMTLGKSEKESREKKQTKYPQPDVAHTITTEDSESADSSQEMESMENEKQSDVPVIPEGLDALSQQLCQLLLHTPKHIDVLAAEMGVGMETLTEALTLLELDGIIMRLPGKQFRML